jgi:hypothetical protein
VALPVQIYALSKSCALAGICVAMLGLSMTFAVDAASFAVSLLAMIVALGHASSLPAAVACLMLAGGADMVSGLHGGTIRACAIDHLGRDHVHSGRPGMHTDASGILALSEMSAHGDCHQAPSNPVSTLTTLMPISRTA